MRHIRLFYPSKTLKFVYPFPSDVPSMIQLDPLSATSLIPDCSAVALSWNTFVLCPPPPLLPESVDVGIPMMVDGTLFG